MRSLLRRWLRHAAGTDEEIAEITTACGEAATNAIEHAGSSGTTPFEVLGRLDGREVDITVRDYGEWRAPREGDQGRGLSLMQALMDSVEVTPTHEGTSVRLRRTPERARGLLMDEIVHLETEQRGEVVVARVTGELDVSGAPDMGDRLGEAVPTSALGLVLDFTELEFIDSSGIAMLFGLVRRLGSRRQELRVVALPGEPVARVLELVEFERAAAIHDDLDAAVSDIA